MADRVSVSITIGGDLAAWLRDAFIETITDEGLFTEWDGPTFDAGQFVQGEPLRLCAHDVAWGRLDDLEGFCLVHHLPFVRWSGGYGGSFGPERVVFTGCGDLRRFAADEEDTVLVCRATVDRLGSYAAILAHFHAADFVVPPLRLTR